MKTLRNLAVIVTVAASSAFIATAFANQGHMDAAIGFLQQAKSELEQAGHDKGGWRVKAISDINGVISDIQAGKAAAQ